MQFKLKHRPKEIQMQGIVVFCLYKGSMKSTPIFKELEIYEKCIQFLENNKLEQNRMNGKENIHSKENNS